MSVYISVNIVSHSLIVLQLINDLSCNTIDGFYHLHFPNEVNRDSVLSFLRQIHWIHHKPPTLSITPTGLLVLSLFDGNTISHELWKVILDNYIRTCSPIWSKRIPYGRKEAFLFMNKEEKRCFVSAGLINSYDKNVISWWDTIANMERQQLSAQQEEAGRTGEYLTMAYEKIRTGKEPDWCSVETNLSGYDILSYRDNNNSARILIEVKSSDLPVSDASFHVSKREWEISQLSNNQGRYFFYLWSLQDNSLAIVPQNEVFPHIPTNNSSGQWLDVKIPFSVFFDHFFSPADLSVDMASSINARHGKL